MPLPANNNDANNNEANSDGEAPLISDAPARPPAPLRRRWWLVVFFLAAVPLALTAIGVATAPPRAAYVPQGRIVFLEADQPSEHTSLLRGLRITLPGTSGSREMLHEAEPQDVDAGSRDWLTQPVVSPDGHWLAYEKQLITLQEEKTGIVNQVWALPLDTLHAVPRLLADLTALRLKQPIGLAWTPDSKGVVFLEDTVQYTVHAQGTPRLAATPLPSLPALRTTSSLSATRSPVVLAPQFLAAEVRTRQGAAVFLFHSGNAQQIIRAQQIIPARTAPPVWAVSLTGRLAATASHSSHRVMVGPDVGINSPSTDIDARWGWSVFGGRRITSLKWSPDGRYLGYTVSKPPFEDELFYADTVTGKCFQLPIRTGRAAWDWTR